MQAAIFQRALKFIYTLLLILLCLSLLPLFLTAAFNYLSYRLLIINISIFILLGLFFWLQQSRYRALKYRLIALMGGFIFCATTLVSPEFNFLLTYPFRQQVVNHFLATHQPVQENVEIRNILLGKTTGYVYSKNASVYFRYYPGIPNMSDRAFILFTTDSVAKIKAEQRAADIVYRQLKPNWFFILTGPSPS